MSIIGWYLFCVSNCDLFEFQGQFKSTFTYIWFWSIFLLFAVHLIVSSSFQLCCYSALHSLLSEDLLEMAL